MAEYDEPVRLAQMPDDPLAPLLRAGAAELPDVDCRAQMLARLTGAIAASMAESAGEQAAAGQGQPGVEQASAAGKAGGVSLAGKVGALSIALSIGVVAWRAEPFAHRNDQGVDRGASAAARVERADRSPALPPAGPGQAGVPAPSVAAPVPAAAPAQASAPRPASLAGTRAPVDGPVRPPAEASVRRPRTAARTGTGAPVLEPDPRAELLLLQRARAALVGDPRRALALAEQHGTRFADGALSQERELVAVEALLRMGARARAERRAKRFEARYPRSLHNRRLAELLR